MNRGGISDPSSRTHLIRVLKWLLFAVELFILWVLCNTLFLVPGPLVGARGLIILVAAPLAAGVAWASGRMFQILPSDEPVRISSILSSPPVVICIFVLSVATLATTVGILATR